MQSTQIRKFILDNLSEHQKDIVRASIRKFGISRQGILRHLNSLIHDGKVAVHGKTKDRYYEIIPTIDFSKLIPISDSINENDIGVKYIFPYLNQLPKNITTICEYGFSNAFNNILSHSNAHHATIGFKQTSQLIQITIQDDGIGCFENIKDVQAVIDLGCGANGFSYSYLKEVFGKINYLGVEASGQLVDNMNKYFLENGFGNAKVVCMDLFRRMQIFNLITKSKSPKVILMLQVIDAMESVSKNSSKEFLLKLKDILNRRDFIIITMPMKSISGRKKFEADRKWLRDFLNKEFKLINEFIFGNERIFRVRKN